MSKSSQILCNLLQDAVFLSIPGEDKVLPLPVYLWHTFLWQECFTYVLKGHIAVSAAIFPNGTKGMLVSWSVLTTTMTSEEPLSGLSATLWLTGPDVLGRCWCNCLCLFPSQHFGFRIPDAFSLSINQCWKFWGGKSEGCSKCSGSRVIVTFISQWHSNTSVAFLCLEVVFMLYSWPCQSERSLSSFKRTG